MLSSTVPVEPLTEHLLRATALDATLPTMTDDRPGTSPLRLEVHRSLDAILPRAAELQALNLASRRPSPFLAPAYLEIFLRHDEMAVEGSEPLLLLAFDGARLVGFLPLRRRPERLLGVTRTRLELLTVHDTDRATLVARPEDEGRCAAAFYRHLLVDEPGWTFLELLEQDAESPLYAFPPGVDASGFYLRRFPTNPNATVVFGDKGFPGWFRGLNNFRSNLSRRTRAVLAAGHAEFVATTDRRASSDLLDLYLDLEARSWKVAAAAGISRHPVRIDLFRAMIGPGQAAEPLFHWLLLDGLPVAGMLSLLHAGGAYQMELAYDEAYGDLSPGNVLFMLGIRDALARGARSYNLLGNFAYHKSRWKAVVTETSAVQVYRRGSLHHAKALAGEWRRRLLGAGRTQRDVEYNLTKPAAAAEPAAEAGPRPDRAPSLALAREVFGRLERAGATLDRLAGPALAAAMPFDAAKKEG